MPADPAPWRCPVCRAGLTAADGGRQLACPAGHTFDRAREGYVNLLLRVPRGRQPGDSKEMVAARRRFLATGAYDAMTTAVAAAVRSTRVDWGDAPGDVLLDVGCGEGHHTRALPAAVRLGVDVAKPAVAAAARADPAGHYAVASAADLPLPDGSAAVAVNVFGPVFAGELARVVRPGGRVVAAHPGPGHLEALRAMVYAESRPHEVKPPLRDSDAFRQVGQERVRWEWSEGDPGRLRDLFSMTPYRWHAPPDIDARLQAAAAHGLLLRGDVLITTYARAVSDRSTDGAASGTFPLHGAS